MATSNNRDVKLGIEIQTAGEESVARLAAQVRALGKEGDPAALGFNHLADELDRLSQQAGAIQSLGALRKDVEGLTLAERETTTAAIAATAAFEKQTTAATELREVQSLARAEVARAKTAYDDLILAYQTLKNEGKGASQSQEAFTASVREAKQQVDEQNRALKARRDALSEANAAVTAASKSETALGKAFEATSKAAQGTQSALQAQSTALTQAEAAAIALGAEVTDLAAAEAKLLETQRAYVGEVAQLRRKASLDQADADRLAAIQARALAEAQRDGAAGAASELAAIKDSEQFTKQYTAAKAAAAKATADLTAAEERRVAAIREQGAADALAAAEARGLAESLVQVRAAAASELAAIKDSELFTKQYAVAAREAAAAVLALEAADQRASLAAKDFAASEAAAAAQFAKLADQAAIANLFANELNRLDAEAQRAAAHTRELAVAGEAVTRAFGQTGVRSLQAIRAEMAGVGTSLAQLERQYRAGAIGADDLARSTSSAQVRLATLRTELQSIPALPNVFESINSSINGLVSRFGALTAAVATLGFVVKPILDANIAFETLRRTLTVVTGSSAVAAQQIEFLRKTANAAGLSAGQLATSFSLFEASLLQSGASVKTTQQLFEGVAGAAGKFGLSTDRVNGILLALGQIANKGKLTLEELQGQIGEALPGALKLAADSLGITTSQLQLLLKDGKILAEDFLPAFGKQLVDTFSLGAKPVEGLAQAFNRLKNAATETSQKLADTSGYKALTNTLDALARNFDTVLGGLGSLAKGFIAFKAIDAAREFFGIKAAIEAAAAAKFKDAEVTAVQTVATKAASAAIAVETESRVIGIAATKAASAAVVLETEALVLNTAARVSNSVAAVAGVGPLSALSTGFGKVVTSTGSAVSKIGSFVGALGGPYGVALAAAIAFSEQLGNGLAYVAAKATGAIGSLKKNEDALRALAAADAVRAAAATAAAVVIRESFVKVQVAYGLQLTAVETNIKVSEKLVKAKKEEGDASITVAELSGNEAAAKTAAANAANGNALAITAELKLKKSEIELLEKERASLVAAAGAQSTWSESRKAFFVTFDQELEKKKADVEVTKQQAVATVAAAEKAFLAAQSFKDNASSVDVFKTAVGAAKENVVALTAAFKEGLTTQERVNSATRELAISEGLLKDAYADAIKAIERRSAAQRESTGLVAQDIAVSRAKQTVDVKIAETTGQFLDLEKAKIALKKLDISTSENTIKASDLEAAALREHAGLLKEQLKLGDPLYAQKKREIESLLNSAAAKTKEGLIERENLRGLGIELGLLDHSLYQTVGSFSALAAAITPAEAALIKAKIAAGELLTETELLAAGNIHLAGSFDSLATAARNNNVRSILGKNTDKDGFATDSKGQRISASTQADVPAGFHFDQQQYNRDAANARSTDRGGGFVDPNNPRYFIPNSTFNTGGVAPPPAKPGAAPGESAALGNPKPAGAGTTHSVNITINGKNTSGVQTASAADSDSLVNMLNQLQSAFRATGGA